MTPFLAVLFDLDGVLVRSEEAWRRLVEEAGRRFRGRPITAEEFAPTFGQGARADVEVFGLACTPEELDRFYADNFRRFVGATWINPDARPLLDALAAQGRRLAVVTNTVTPLAHEILDVAGLLDRFPIVVCADQVARPKPAPDVVVRACEQLGIGAEQACMVGDSRYDREAAKAAGVRFVGLGLDGDARIERLGELAALVG